MFLGFEVSDIEIIRCDIEAMPIPFSVPDPDAIRVYRPKSGSLRPTT